MPVQVLVGPRRAAVRLERERMEPALDSGGEGEVLVPTLMPSASSASTPLLAMSQMNPALAICRLRIVWLIRLSSTMRTCRGIDEVTTAGDTDREVAGLLGCVPNG
jgi:hypothetical protein